MVKCAVRACPNQSSPNPKEIIKRPRKRFFRFPAEKSRVRVWLAALREPEGYFSPEHQHICEDHFLPQHITPNGISPEAIPIMPPLEGALLGTGGWSSAEEPGEEPSDPAQVVTEIPPDNAEEEDDDDDDDEEDDNNEEDEDGEDSDNPVDEPSQTDHHTWKEADKEWLDRLQENLKNSRGKKRPGTTPRSDVTLGQLTKRFIDLFQSAPEGILDLNEAAKILGTRKRRVYDITHVLDAIKLITKKSKNKVQWIGPTPINYNKGYSEKKVKVDLLNLKTMEEALDWLIKDCAQQLFDLTDLKSYANSAYVTYDDICGISALQDQTVIIVKAPEETKLEVPTPTEERIQIHLKASKGQIHVLTCETDGQGSSTQSEKQKKGRFLTLEESRIETSLLKDVS
ncbi:transcription factor E2F6 [Trichomycterus rosablanca]|uniref:transcription factor E2F6 n=1 Tax=Trichomycterus rosablanca TaxID=2290929 RepID=UPI002F354AF3